MTNYYEIAPLLRMAKQLGTVTYSSKKNLNDGDMVKIQYGKKTATGVVISKTSKPSFPTKEVDEPILALHKDLIKLASWLENYYNLDCVGVWNLILPSNLHKQRRPSKTKLHTALKKKAFQLTQDQTEALRLITAQTKPSLLHGVTGSGKTRVMTELIRENLSSDKDSVVLSPEIGLSSQMLAELEREGFKVIHLHSELTEAQYHNAWQAIHNSTEPLTVLGPRSAIFAPVRNLGLIVVDEAHDSSYKQETQPYYNSIHVAGARAKLNKAKLLLASATPNIADYYLADRNLLNKPTLPKRVHPTGKHSIQVVDKKDKQEFSQSKFISTKLLNSIESSIQLNKQSLIFLNRRGHSPVIACNDCAWKAECTNCHHPLNYHSSVGKIICHICGLRQKPIVHCPDCGSADVIYSGTGIQKIEKELQKLFPHAKIQRVDRDITQSKTYTHEKMLHDTRTKNVDILLGTQMLSKGFDFEHLETVGVIDADTMLYIPDFRSEERTFQMLAQIIGRNDRRGLGARTFVQTLNPSNPAIKNSLTENYQAFYDYEIEQRREHNYPPFCYLLKITTRQKTDQKARTILQEIKQKYGNKLQTLGPAPSLYSPAKFKQWHLVVKSKSRKNLLELAKKIDDKNINCNFDPLDLL